MCVTEAFDTPPLTEPTPPMTIFVSGLDRIYPVGGSNYCFVLYTHYMPPGGGPPERRAEVNIIAPRDCLPDSITKTLAILGRRVIVDITGAVRSLM